MDWRLVVLPGLAALACNGVPAGGASDAACGGDASAGEDALWCGPSPVPACLPRDAGLDAGNQPPADAGSSCNFFGTDGFVPTCFEVDGGLVQAHEGVPASSFRAVAAAYGEWSGGSDLVFYSSEAAACAGYGLEDSVTVFLPRTEGGRWAGPGDHEVHGYDSRCPWSLPGAARWISWGREVPAQADGIIRLYDQCESGYWCGKADILFDFGCERRRLLVEFAAGLRWIE